MALELHTWGPAFGLPSIDAECIAAIALLTLAVPKADPPAWVLIPGSDPNIVPTQKLPALWTGLRWVSGFENIVQFLKQYSGGKWNLDGWVSPEEKSDIVALSCVLESRGTLLIDLSLYDNSENYRFATSPAYGTMLQWPNQWIIPPAILSRAKARAALFGVHSANDPDVEQERQQGRSSIQLAAAHIPKSLTTKPRETMSSALGQASSRFRLRNLVDFVATPLEEVITNKDPSARRVSTLDCLALGYISLALIPNLPDPWLKDYLLDLAPSLCSYVDEMQASCFGGQIDAAAVLSGNVSNSHLPWQLPPKIGLAGIGRSLLEGVADSIPVIKDIRLSRRLQETGMEASLNPKEVSTAAKHYRQDALVSAATTVIGVGMFVFYIFKVGLVQVVDTDEEQDGEEPQPGSADEPQRAQSQFGEAGSILGL
ncbi:hypothetical protein LOZ53_005263 [Ophidiomyces ophidiicola]|uniref:Uncharacterized protein n=1 Tax=Ophidiomyces ophidiicola TaxID=1387563 RepID=A0ACB8V4E2_9EURO|nr:uncharacterized protein LOZ57_003236 [Ophidiomyces ophidiicola]KAI1906785.1 hypothetical protein LOZ64_006120 [Ophidiomyces ophidiicola]KAI1907041.1 hypothetical protein LOZ61_006361 [Ophidiomyces ophidiicola]KAI1926260.1 hypothetical protein LOZ60_003736 [Ophidiomyces ophidiicola]KAI1946634.1 hypothetical protein LOZ62_003220 [Ophidiomyces ophidiicola]KAI1947507.1 hypothetical protein LOZ57_003236 [Ophidiomyces ophidiicola]